MQSDHDPVSSSVNSASENSTTSSPTGLSFSISAPGKVILHGEHSVVYDQLAIAASLGLRTRLTFIEPKIKNSSSSTVTLELPTLSVVQGYDLSVLREYLLNKPLPLTTSSSNYNWKTPELLNHNELLLQVQDFVNKNKGVNRFTAQQHLSLCSILYLFMAILHSVDIAIQPFVLRIDTDLIVGAGTGSSASFAVTVAAAFIHYIRLKPSQAQLKNISKSGYKPTELIHTNLKCYTEKELELISKWAFMAEKIIHGSPSGIDNTVCTYGSVVEFKKSGGLKLIPKCEFELLLINTGIQRDTKLLVKRVATLKERQPEIVKLILHAMNEVSKSALPCLLQLNQYGGSNKEEPCNSSMEVKKLYETLQELISINQHLLQALDVSHPSIDKICTIVKNFGLHSKLTGAGGGGYTIALIPPYISKQVVQQLIIELNSEGFQSTLTKLGGSGVTID